MYYLGNLTIKSETPTGVGVIFQIPNYVIEELYWQYYAYILRMKIEFKFEDDQVKEAIYKATTDNIDAFFVLIEKALKELSNRDFQRFDEKYVKMLIIAFAR